MTKLKMNHNLILDKCNLNKIIIKGKKLNCRWFGKLEKNKENEVGYVDLNDYKRFTKTLGRMGNE